MRAQTRTSANSHAKTERVRSLDGLRGVAAVIVLIHHSLLTIPTLAEPYYSVDPAEFGSAKWWLIHTPLHMLWEGKAAVYVFFVLSGLVLTLPVINRSGPYSWRRFYPQRLVRLYLPVWGSVVLAAIVFWALPRSGSPSSMWLRERPQEMNPKGLLESLTLVFGPGGLISPLWSLQWEVLFSLAVPLYIWLALRLRKRTVLILIACFLSSTVGGVMEESVLLYPPMFMIGVIVAMQLGRIRERTATWSNAQWVGAVLSSFVLMSAHWIALAFSPSPLLLGSMTGVTLAGSTMIVIAAIGWSRFAAVLTKPSVLWLGVISFSLYLVHEPIVVGLGYIAGADLWWSIPTGIIVSVLIAQIFYKTVELPSHRLAKRLRQL